MASNRGVDVTLVEKDYWIMHCLWGLQQQDLRFELKGGTSLSKGFGVIHRFSEDIDLRIEPPEDAKVFTGKNHTKEAHVESRKAFYDRLAETIIIDGLIAVERDHEFDNERYFSGGVRLLYPTVGAPIAGIKTGILLEVGFDDVTPNAPRTISSWAYDFAVGQGVEVIDNRAKDVACYSPGHTLVEKLQAISTKYRRRQETGDFPPNFMRHYYDVHSLLQLDEVQAFVGTKAYVAHKAKRFPRADEPDLRVNPAFVLPDEAVRDELKAAYARSSALYYQGQPPFEEILATITQWAPRL
ncbi:nucleotidyl transferase AbiEii/AbiGii toxin family protein [Caulobacter sp. AP07]|uniref:nucleotidyl transferase AbiEii/AbiGii toxin family protein n=1 Tax=Caulobacter sp. AP07 TaxID=1144304 RepID=UPI001EE66A74|nr:nucleotidyl transferase AbiEii/AbiGii toxin family protein [Caulobacter sp. AP07]